MGDVAKYYSMFPSCASALPCGIVVRERGAVVGVRENFQKLIDKKQDEIRELEVRIRESTAYLQALQDSLRLLPRDDFKQQSNGSEGAEASLRPGSALATVRGILAEAGTPIHVNQILEKMGKPVDQKGRTSLVGTLGSYSRKGRIFTRPAPNTFGLIEVGVSPSLGDEIPDDFGKMA